MYTHNITDTELVCIAIVGCDQKKKKYLSDNSGFCFYSNLTRKIFESLYIVKMFHIYSGRVFDIIAFIDVNIATMQCWSLSGEIFKTTTP